MKIHNINEVFIMYKRLLSLPRLLEKKSFFLLGPRSTGKTTLIETQLPRAKVYDLLDSEIFRRLLQRPRIIEEEIGDPAQIIVIDEIQKLPQLLDEVHRLIQKKNIRFLLTGSSARKLKRGGQISWPDEHGKRDYFPWCSGKSRISTCFNISTVEGFLRSTDRLSFRRN